MKRFFAELENVIMCLMTYFFAIIKDIFKIYFKSLAFSKQCSSYEIWYCQWQIFQCNTSFYRLDLVASFSNYRNTSMLWFYFYYFLCFSYGHQFPCDQWSNIFEHCFSYFLVWFSHGSLMEINSTHVYFGSRIMLCFTDEKQKEKNTFKDNS